MAEFRKFSQHEENTCEMKSTVQIPITEENGNNVLLNQSSRDSNELTEEKISKLLLEKLQLDEKGKELQRLTINLMQEHRRLTAERQSQERAFMKSDKNPASIAREIRDRLLFVYTTGKQNELAFENFLDYTRKKLRNTNLLNVDNNTALQRKLTVLEAMFSAFQGQLITIETLMKPDYDILCKEDEECFTDVMKECNKVEDIIYNITSKILED